MSIFGTDYQRGFNAARNQQISEQICAGLNRRREQDRAQRQHAAQQGLIQAMQLQILQLQQENARLWQDNMRLQRDNAEYERFINWAMAEIDQQNGRIAKLQDAVGSLINEPL